jgi:hypothetical protein
LGAGSDELDMPRMRGTQGRLRNGADINKTGAGWTGLFRRIFPSTFRSGSN